jgi:hypothetical protein
MSEAAAAAAVIRSCLVSARGCLPRELLTRAREPLRLLHA